MVGTVGRRHFGCRAAEIGRLCPPFFSSEHAFLYDLSAKIEPIMDVSFPLWFSMWFYLSLIYEAMFDQRGNELLGVGFPAGGACDLGITELAEVAIHGIIHGPKP